MAESETTSSVDRTAQDESSGPAQAVTQDSEPAAAVAVMDPPVDEPTQESSGVAEGSEDNVTESVADGQEPIATPIESVPSPNPVPAAEDISTDISEPVPVAVTTQPEGMAGGESVSVAEKPQDSASPTDSPAEEATETGSTGMPDPSQTMEAEPAEVSAEVSPRTPDSEVSTAVETEPADLHDDATIAIPEAVKPDTLENSNLDIPSMPIDENATEEKEKNPEHIQPVVIPTVPMRAAFLPVWSSRSRPGYSLRGLF